MRVRQLLIPSLAELTQHRSQHIAAAARIRGTGVRGICIRGIGSRGVCAGGRGGDERRAPVRVGYIIHSVSAQTISIRKSKKEKKKKKQKNYKKST